MKMHTPAVKCVTSHGIYLQRHEEPRDSTHLPFPHLSLLLPAEVVSKGATALSHLALQQYFSTFPDHDPCTEIGFI